MDKVLAFLVPILTFIAGYYGPIQLAKIQGKQKKEEVKMEGDSSAEELYVAATERQYARYEAEIVRIENSFNRRIEDMEKEFDRKFEEINKKYNHVLEENSFLEREIEIRDERIEELESKNSELKDRILYLKGES